MSSKITSINLGIVNCFLIDSEAGFFLVDSGLALRRKALEGALLSAGCQPSDLRLALITHGDLDHIGNCAYLQQNYGVKIAMHPADAGMAERGDMGVGRHVTGTRKLIFKFLPFLLAYRPFSPDLLLNDKDDLNAWGLDAQVYHLPGHSSGSIGILTAEGDLFCGDLLYGSPDPSLHFIVDQPDLAQTSIERLKTLGVRTVYPGHGGPFDFDTFIKSYAPPAVSRD